MDSEIDEGEFVDNENDREEILKVTQVVNLRGMPVGTDFDLEAGDLLNGSVTDADPDRELFEREERTVSLLLPT
jgi:hypothetical protein